MDDVKRDTDDAREGIAVIRCKVAEAVSRLADACEAFERALDSDDELGTTPTLNSFEHYAKVGLVLYDIRDLTGKLADGVSLVLVAALRRLEGYLNE